MSNSHTHAPALSQETIMSEFPDARMKEVDALLDLLHLEPGSVVIDIQAAGGYVSDTLHTRMQGNISCICLEPTPELNRRIRPIHEVCVDPLDNWHSIPSGSADAVVGLAGLHHSPNKYRTIDEAYRSLHDGGEFAVCDVEQNSDVAVWLNEYVDHHNPAGHQGDFLQRGELSSELERAGFSEISEKQRYVPWLFQNESELARFFKGLFGLVSDPREVLGAVKDYLNIRQHKDGICVDWHLIYASGRKATG